MKDQLEALVAQMHNSGILFSEALREFRKRYVMNVLAENNFNQCRAARALGTHRNSLSRWIVELGISVSDYKPVRRGRKKGPQKASAPLPMSAKAGA